MTPTENNPAEFVPLDPALEQAVSEIRNDVPDSAVIEAAAARVWAKLSVEVAAHPDHAHPIRNCEDFQALLPDYRAGRLTDARATLVKDHPHQCVACRRIYEGRVVEIAAPVTTRRSSRRPIYWMAAAAAVAGIAVWVTIDQYGVRTGHAIVQSVNGTLY